MPYGNDIEDISLMEIVEYYKQKDKERRDEIDKTIETGKDFVNFYEREGRGEIEYNETIEKFFIELLLYTCADPELNGNLREAIADYNNRQYFRVEHPEYQRKLQIQVKGEWFNAVSGHAQVKDAISSGRDLEVSKKMKIHTKIGLIGRLRSALGYTQEDKEWTE